MQTCDRTGLGIHLTEAAKQRMDMIVEAADATLQQLGFVKSADSTSWGSRQVGHTYFSWDYVGAGQPHTITLVFFYRLRRDHYSLL